jgi:gliding motility-associated lipoprotein GldD
MVRIRKIRLPVIIIVLCILCSCRELSVPKPKGYFRIDLPQKEYVLFNEVPPKSGKPLLFEYPAYGHISNEVGNRSEPGWFNIEFPAYKAKIYLTYKDIKNDLAGLIEQTYTMNVKNHITKADAINEQIISNHENQVYGILYDLKGNTATSVQFYVTDSIKHYLRGSLYFAAEPNADSLAPVIDFFREDIIHLIETLRWKEN